MIPRVPQYVPQYSSEGQITNPMPHSVLTIIIFKHRVQFSYAVAVFSWVALLTYSILEYDSSNRAVKPPVVIPTLDCEVDVEDYHSVNY